MRISKVIYFQLIFFSSCFFSCNTISENTLIGSWEVTNADIEFTGAYKNDALAEAGKKVAMATVYYLMPDNTFKIIVKENQVSKIKEKRTGTWTLEKKDGVNLLKFNVKEVLLKKENEWTDVKDKNSPYFRSFILYLTDKAKNELSATEKEKNVKIYYTLSRK